MPTKKQTTAVGKELEKIAREVLGIETLASRHSDSLDFSDQGVVAIRTALERAFAAGMAFQQKATAPAPLPTNNPAFGFWGTMGQMGLTPGAQEASWAAAMGALCKRLDITDKQARLILDAKFGRHLADQIDVGPLNSDDSCPITPAKAALKTIETVQATLEKQGWAREALSILAEVE